MRNMLCVLYPLVWAGRAGPIARSTRAKTASSIKPVVMQAGPPRILSFHVASWFGRSVIVCLHREGKSQIGAIQIDLVHYQSEIVCIGHRSIN
ncbi:hypothetical protein CRG98_011005, partial [Punica granatum]